MNTPNTKTEISVKVSPATIGCLVLLVSFFLPWIRFFGGSVAGYEVGKLSANWQWLWAIPILAGVAVLLGFAGKRHVEVAQTAGALPLLGLGVALYQHGTEIFQALLLGAYATLICGVFLLAIAPRLGRKTAAPEAASVPSADNS